ncbi:MAG: adenylosuccinate synthase [Victivallales bacterium]|nr:adenylosuccinate synthase [Victivallales bacterium]
MANTVLVGLQWGDEGKGKIIDVLTREADVVVRFQGGNNAGHTVEIGANKFVLHLIPSGILRPEAQCVIGNGLVVSVIGLQEELDGLEAKGIDISDRLFISDRCQLIFAYHCMADGLKEGQLGENKIGTTKRGIGPAYADKANRCGIRARDLQRPDVFRQKFYTEGEKYNRLFAEYGAELLDLDAEWAKLAAIAERLAPMVTDTTLLLNRAADAGKAILFEGAQGTWLDIDFGTYPFVTSSNTTVGGACTGTGMAPSRINEVVGVLKAYTTRVGAGPFPTELDDDLGESIRQKGGEFGATTGRPRRCGWFDAVATRYSVMLNGVTGIALTKMDVLDGLETLKICTAYELDGKVITDMPADSDDLARSKPVYEDIAGWCEATTGVTDYEQLPELAKAYIDRLMEVINARAQIISVGPRRAQTFDAPEK